MTLEERIKQMLEESTKPTEVIAERADREDDECYSRTKDADDAYNKKMAAKPAKKKSITEEEFDAMTQEEFDSIDEEDLDEISQGLQQNLVAGRITQNRAAGSTLNAAKKSVAAIKPIAAAKPELFAQKKKEADDAQTSKNTTQNKLGKTASLISKRGGDYNAMATKHVIANPLKESEVSSQVASLLEAEGLSEEFKVQAVTIFEAAVTDRVLQIQEEMEAEYNEKLDEARAEIETNIDGFLNEAVQEWANNNEVAIKSNFKTRLAESFMDGIQSLLAEHNIDLPAESEDALEIALDQVNKLEEEADQVQTTIAELQEQVSGLKAEKILESFKEKMTSTEFDRFAQLTESVKFKDESQYEKQLNVVLENFGKITKKHIVADKTVETIVEQITEDALVQTAPIVTETFNSVNRYAEYFASKAK